MATGLFVGLVTLDLVYLTAALPQPNQKQVALDYTIAAGGPATNAAVTFQYLANASRLMGVIGRHPMSQFVLADLQNLDVIDLAPESTQPIPTSSILVTQATGERAVISLNAVRLQAESARLPAACLTDVDILLLDGHQMAVGQVLAQQAKALNIPIVVDAGSWKPGFATVLRYADSVIASANFAPPDCRTPEETVYYLQALGVPQIAITQGEAPIRFYSATGQGEIAVPQIDAVDTVGAGDVLHGAFCHFICKPTFGPPWQKPPYWLRAPVSFLAPDAGWNPDLKSSPHGCSFVGMIKGCSDPSPCT